MPSASGRRSFFSHVSLFTREWIEMSCNLSFLSKDSSPSLRGSGLKFISTNQHRETGASLPLYEGVD